MKIILLRTLCPIDDYDLTPAETKKSQGKQDLFNDFEDCMCSNILSICFVLFDICLTKVIRIIIKEIKSCNVMTL